MASDMKTSTPNPPSMRVVATKREGAACAACPTACLKLRTLSSALNGRNNMTSRQRAMKMAKIPVNARLLSGALHSPLAGEGGPKGRMRGWRHQAPASSDQQRVLPSMGDTRELLQDAPRGATPHPTP